jgi:hypothetical protein
MSFVDVKYIGLISSKLNKFKQVNRETYQFRCPYCGDSKKYQNKARGYFYFYKNNYNYKCHNCSKSISFASFLKDIDQSLYDQYIMERYSNGMTGKGSNVKEPQFNFTPPVFHAKQSIDLPTIEELNKEHPAKVYVEERKIPKKFHSKLYFCDKFKEWTNTKIKKFKTTDPDEGRIIIPLFNHNKFFGYQGRSLDPESKVRYVTIIFDSDHPKIYGLDDVDMSKPVYITEGAFDSFFLDNSIAMLGSDYDRMFILTHYETKFIVIYDNDRRNKEIVNKLEKAIDEHFDVVIWPDINEKDINEMVLAGHDVKAIVESNTYCGLEAKLKFTNWKKV